MSTADVVRGLAIMLAIGFVGQAISMAVQYGPKLWARWDMGRWFR